MFSLIGKITARILGGEISQDAVFPEKRPGGPPPKASSVRYGKGQALGKPNRSDRSAKTHED